MANRVRGKQRPEEPTDLEFTVDDLHVPESFLRADVRVKDRRHLVFANDQQVALLSKAKTWYVRGRDVPRGEHAVHPALLRTRLREVWRFGQTSAVGDGGDVRQESQRLQQGMKTKATSPLST